MNSFPDGVLGAILGFESVGAGATIINGMGGCRPRTLSLLHDLIPEYSEENPTCCERGFFGMQSQLPCTYVDGTDIVFGANRKVSEGIMAADAIIGGRTTLVDTLAMSLLCLDKESIEPAVLTVDGDLSSMSFDEGFDSAVRVALEGTDVEQGEDVRAVNVLGYGIPDPGWTYGVKELGSLLSAMGVRVNAFVGCRPSPEELRSSGKSSLNIMLHPSRCTETAGFYRDFFGTPSIRLERGMPIGYRATRTFLSQIADFLDTEPGPALDLVDEDENAVRSMLLNADRAVEGLRAKRYSVKGESDTVLPLIEWMTGVFGMIPGSVATWDSEYCDEIFDYLTRTGFVSAMGAPEPPDTEVYFTDGIAAAEGRLNRGISAYVEVCMPRGRTLDLTGRCLIGRVGCRYMLDEMINGITRFRCGQPTLVDVRIRKYD